MYYVLLEAISPYVHYYQRVRPLCDVKYFIQDVSEMTQVWYKHHSTKLALPYYVYDPSSGELWEGWCVA